MGNVEQSPREPELLANARRIEEAYGLLERDLVTDER